MLYTLGRIVLFAVGIPLLCMSAFVYKTELGVMQSRLEDLWIMIDDRVRKAVGRNTAFLGAIAKIVNASFNRFFGERILSWRAFAVSACYSVASGAFMLLLSVLHPNWGLLWSNQTRSVPYYLAAALFYGLIGTLPAIGARKLPQWPWLILTLLSLCGLITALGVASGSAASTALAVVPLVLGMCSNFLVLVVNRKLLRWSLSVRNVHGPAAIVVGNLVLGMVLFFPQFLVLKTNLTSFEKIVISLGCMSNLMTTLIAVLVLLSALALVLHRLAWPFLARPVYAIQDHHLVQNKKLQALLGLLCVLTAMGALTFIQALLKLL
jgi:hypothetical protein